MSKNRYRAFPIPITPKIGIYHIDNWEIILRAEEITNAMTPKKEQAWYIYHMTQQAGMGNGEGKQRNGVEVRSNRAQ